MANESTDYEQIRQRVEKRLEPRLKLRRRRTWFFVHIVVFVVVTAVLYSDPAHNTALYQSIIETYDTFTWTRYEPYSLAILASVLWFVALIAQGLLTWGAFQREKFIQREVDREMAQEIEKLRLQIELAKASGYVDETGAYSAEKAKRTVRLSDDGELIEEAAPQPLRRSRS